MQAHTLGGVAAACAVLMMLSPVLEAAYTDVDILQFALNLEVRIRLQACIQFGIIQ